MTIKSFGEHRLERRLPGLNTAVKIRRRGLGFNPWRSDLTLVDLSANGMALTSPTFKMDSLQKIDFELSSGGYTTAGCAVVCYAGDNENQQRYGLLFIETDAEFDSFLTGETLSSAEVNRLGEEMAEQFMRRRKPASEDAFNLQNQRMVDAVRSLANRLGQMGLYVTGVSGEALLPADSIMVGKNGGLSLPMKNAATGEIFNAGISITHFTDSAAIGYQIAEGPTFSNIIDLLDHICTCFEKIAQP